MTERPDYEKILEELMAERSNIEVMIAWVQKKLAQNGVASPPVSTVSISSSEPIRFPRLAQDTFFRMSFPQAIKEFLNISKRPMSAMEITAALQDGGLTHQAKNLYSTVYPTLLRMEKAKEVARVGKRKWGLAEWYAGRKSGDDSEKKKEE